MSVFQNTRKLLFVVLLVFISLSSKAFSDKLEVSVLTYDPGKELYTLFGHSAIRVRDSVTHFDKVYNFGTFDFDTPFFVFHFAKGNLDYCLAVKNYGSFYRSASREKRRVYEQVLDLSYADKLKIYNRLDKIYHSPERYYRYDFFFDNCATRIRDMVDEGYMIAGNYDTTTVCNATFRELLLPYLSENYWLNLGVNLTLGSRADSQAKSSEFMFLPDYVFKILKLTGKVKKTTMVMDKRIVSGSKSMPVIILISVLTLLLVLAVVKPTRKITFYLVNGVVALVGVLLLLLSSFSENSAFQSNGSIIWTLPALLVILTPGKYKQYAKYVYLFVLFVVLLLRNNLYAGFSPTYIPWVAYLLCLYLLDLRLFERIFQRMSKKKDDDQE